LALGNGFYSLTEKVFSGVVNGAAGVRTEAHGALGKKPCNGRGCDKSHDDESQNDGTGNIDFFLFPFAFAFGGWD